ncbi:MAG: CHAT domain-containing tetratricopeptide repeat protein, partial [Bacteroidota bacterium]
CETSQKESESGEITLDSAIALAKYVQNTVAGDSCIDLYKNAMRLAKKEENYGRKIYLHDKLADTYIYFNQYKTGKLHLDSALEIANIHDTHYEWIGMCYASLGVYYTNIRDFENGLNFLEKALAYRIKNLGADHEDISNSYASLGYYYFTTRREFDKSIEYNEKALELRIKSYGKESAQAAECYYNLALAYHEFGDTKKAIKFQQKAVAVMEKTFTKNSLGILNGYSLLGNFYSIIGENNTAIEWYRKILAAEKNNENQYIKIGILNDLGDAYLMETPLKAKSFYDSCLSILNSKFGKNHAVTISTHQKLSNYYQLNKRFDSAIYHLKLASDLTAQSRGINSIDYSKISLDFAKLFLSNKQYNKSIGKSDEAINAITSFQYSPEDRKSALSNDEKLNRIDLANAYFLKAKALSKINNTSSMKSGLNFLLEAIEIIENIKSKYSSNESRSYLSNQTEIIFDHAIQIAIKLANITGEQYYKEYAFSIAEKSRSFNLLAEINKANAKKFSGIPREILEKEEKLKRDITFYDELVYQYSIQSAIDSSGLEKLKSTLFEKERQYDVFIKQLENNFPKYHEIKNQVTNVTIQSVQKNLTDDEALLEYFIGDSNFTTFIITKNDFKIINHLKHNKLQSTVTELYNSINKFDKNKVEKLSKSIYKSIFSGPVGKLNNRITKLKIVPHKELAYLPFDCLINDQNQFVIENFTTSYYYSASLLKPENQINSDDSKNILLYAPIYDNQNDFNVPPLERSESEAKEIGALFRSNGNQVKMALRNEATKSNFESLVEEFDIVHLATHTFVKKEAINFSEINFWMNDGDNSENTLTLSETFNLNLDTQLLTLSSCESGVGELIKGEGMMSFTRGFSYSGAQNIVCSLWKVNDLFTSDTMIEMYKNINEGMSYDESLRQAKLKLIKKNPDLSPKDWAGFILISND